MRTGVIVFIISWLIYWLFADKRKFPSYVLTGYIGIILALMTDLLTFVYPLWIYPETQLGEFIVYMLNAFGLYFITIYFFLQTLPNKQNKLSIIRHIFFGTVYAITLEFLFINIGFIQHGLWWNIGFSYLADWILFTIFYVHHKWILDRLHLVKASSLSIKND